MNKQDSNKPNKSAATKRAPVSKKQARKPLISALEPRLLLDGAAVVTAVDAFTDSQLHDAFQADANQQDSDTSVVIAPTEVRGLDPAQNNGKKEVVFIVDNVADSQTLIDGIRAGIEIVLLDSTQDGLAQMALWAEHNSDYDAIHIISHGTEGQVNLGGFSLDNITVNTRSADLAQLGAALNEEGDLLLYGCSVASGEGQDFISALAQATQADVAASDDLTGAAVLGGDWILEKQTGVIEAADLTAGFADRYAHTLETITFVEGSLEDYSANADNSFTRTISGAEFTFSVGSTLTGTSASYLDIQTDSTNEYQVANGGIGPGIYALTDRNNYSGLDFSIKVESGYTFDLTGFEAQLKTGELSVYYIKYGVSGTQQKDFLLGGTDVFQVYSGITDFDDITEIVFTTEDYGLFQNLIITDVKATPANTAPTLSNLDNDSVAWAGEGNIVTLDNGADAVLADAELGALNGGNGNWSGASLTVQRQGTAVSGDQFGFDTSDALFTVSGNELQSGGDTFATFTNTNGVLTINYTSSATIATTALANDVAQRITYANNTPAGDAIIHYTLSDGSSSTTADVTVTSDTIYVTNSTDTATIDASNGVSFSEAVAIAANQSGTQTLVLSSAFSGTTLAGDLAINESLSIDADAANTFTISGSTMTLGAGTTLSLSNGNNDNAIIASTLDGDGSLAKTGDGQLTLSGSNSYDGSTTVTGGTLSISNDNNLGTGDVILSGGANFITVNNVLTVDNNFAIETGGATFIQTGSGHLTLSGQVAGDGKLIKAGGGSMTLSANNEDFAGGVQINNGTLNANASVESLGYGAVTLVGGTLAFSDAGTVGNGITVSADATIANSANVTLSGIISGDGALTKAGAGTLTLSADENTHSGAVTVSAGTLALSGGSSIGDDSAVTVDSGASLSLLLGNETIGSLAGAGSVSLGYSLTVGNASSTTFSGVISSIGTYGINKVGTGTLTLSGANTYTGSTTVSSGTLEAAGGSAIADNSALTVASGATFRIENYTLSETVGSIAGAGSIVANGGTLTVGGNNASTIFSGVISEDTALTKLGSGTLTLSGNNTYSGNTAVLSGGLSISGDSNLGYGALTLNSGTLSVTGDGANIDNAISLLSNGGVVNVDTGVTATLSGVVSGVGALTKSGDGKLTLSAGNTLTGALRITDGTLAFGANNNISSTSGLTLDGGTLASSATVTYSKAISLGSNGGTLNISGGSMGLSGVISGDGRLTSTSTNAGNVLTLSGNNTYTGGTTLNSGILQFNNDNAVGSGTLTIEGGKVRAGLVSRTLSNDLVLDGTVTMAGSYALTFTGGVDLGGVDRTIDNSINSDLTFSGVMNNGSLTIAGGSGTGAVILSGTNTHTNTTISGGNTTTNTNSLSIASDANLGTGTLTLNGAGAVLNITGATTIDNAIVMGSSGGTLNNTDAVTLSGVVSGTGAFTKVGAGVLTLSGSNTYTGTTTVSAGTLKGDTSSLVGDITNNAAVEFNQGVVGVYANTISGSGSLFKSGAGALTLTGSNTYAGVTTIAAGKVIVGNDAALGSTTGATTVSSGATLELADGVSVAENITLAGAGASASGALRIDSGSSATLSGNVTMSANSIYRTETDAHLTLSGVVSGGFNLTKAGAGTLALSGTNTYTGATSVTAGILSVTGALNGSGAGAVTVNAGTLEGTGTINSAVTVNSGATLSAGGAANTGTLTINGDLAIRGGALSATINSASDYDKVVVNGTVTVDQHNNSTLSLSGDYVVPVGGTAETFELISNDDTDAVSGTFSNLSSGTITFNGVELSAAYDGGTGNDFLLTGPEAVGVTAISAATGNGSYKAGEVIAITVTFDDAVTVSGTPQLTLETGTTDRVVDYVSGSGTDTLSFIYTIQAGDTSADLDYISTAALSLNGGTIKDAANNDAILTLATPGATGSLGANKDIVIDTTAPDAPSAPDLSVASDSGISYTDNITNDTTPTIMGTAEANTTVVLYDTDGSTVLGSATADGSGNWSITSSTLAAGNHILTVKAMDTAGNVSLASSGLTVTIDNVAPTLDSTNPSNNAVLVAPSGDITLTFDEGIAKGYNTISLVNVTTGVTVETFDVLNGGNLTFSGNTLTLDPTMDLDEATAYAIQIDGNAIRDIAGNTYAGISDNTTFNFTTGTIDTTAPTVAIVDVTSPNQPNAGTVNINFSEQVINVDISDFSLTKDGAAVDISGLAVAGSGNAYSIDLSSVTAADGIYVLTLNTSDITDTSGNALAMGDSETFTIDTTAPTGVAIERVGAETQSGSAATFTAVFSEAVSGVDAADFTLTGTATGGSITGVTQVSESVYTITVSGVSSDGTLGVNLKASGTGITDTAGNAISTGMTGQQVTLDNQGPSAVAINRDGAALTNADSATFTVTFDEAVTGVDISDFILMGSAAGTIASVTGSGSTYQVTVNNISGDGSLRLDLNASGTGIIDVASNAIGAGFTSGDTVTIDNTAAVVTPDQSFNLDEGMATGTVIGQVNATDANGVSQFTIQSGNDAGYFSIDSDGVLTLTSAGAAAIDYESVTSYTLDIVATDVLGQASGPVAITIAIQDINDNAPVFSSGNTASIAENTAITEVVYDANATDADASTAYNSVTYSLKATGDHSAFTINSNTGEVKLIASADYETKSSYSFTVIASDGMRSTEQAVTLSVTDVNEAPVITSGNTGNVDENAATSTVIYTATATDVDGGDTLTYSLTGADAALLEINATTGDVTLKASADYETKTSYSFTVVATDNGASNVNSGNLSVSQAVVVSVNDLNDNAPTLSAGAATATLVEAGGVNNATAGTNDASITLTKSDVDTVGVVGYDGAFLTNNGWTTTDNGATYSRAGTYGTATITTSTDVIRYILNNNATNTQSLTSGQSVTDSFTIQITDGNATGTTTAVFEITGANDAPIVSGTVANMSGTSGQIFTPVTLPANLFSDLDANETAQLIWSIENLPTGLVFNAATRTISGTPQGGFEGVNTLQIVATDINGAQVKTPVTLTLNPAPVVAPASPVVDVAPVVPVQNTGFTAPDIVTLSSALPTGVVETSGGSRGFTEVTASAGVSQAQPVVEAPVNNTPNVGQTAGSNAVVVSESRVAVNVGADGQVQVSEASGVSSNVTGLSVATIVPQGERVSITIADTSTVARYSGTLADGTQLPDWVTVNPTTGEVTMTPPQGEEIITLKINAVDADGNTRILEIEVDLSSASETAPPVATDSVTVNEAVFKSLDEQLIVAAEQYDDYGSGLMKLLVS